MKIPCVFHLLGLILHFDGVHFPIVSLQGSWEIYLGEGVYISENILVLFSYFWRGAGFRILGWNSFPLRTLKELLQCPKLQFLLLKVWWKSVLWSFLLCKSIGSFFVSKSWKFMMVCYTAFTFIVLLSQVGPLTLGTQVFCSHEVSWVISLISSLLFHCFLFLELFLGERGERK